MGIHRNGLCRGVVAGSLLLAFSSLNAGAQAPAAQSSAEQKNRVAARVTDQVDDTNRTVLRGNVHPKARAEFDGGAVADAQPVTRMVLLLQRSAEQEAALRQLMEEQQSKGSPNYHAWLTPDQFGAQFGPADADVQAVTAWLTSHGFQNIKVGKGRTTVEFSGNVGQVRNAFATEIHKYNVNGEEHFANVSDPQIPAALAPVVRGIAALHNFRPKPMLHRLGTFQRNAKTGEVRPAFTFTDVNGTFYAMGPADFATIYNIPSGSTGAGQSIAIVGQSNINLQDVTNFRSIFGLPAYSPGQLNVILNGPDPGLVSGDEGESDLDVEWAGAIAPAATIDFVVTESTQTDATAGIDGSAMYIVDNNIAPILSESYGACESGLGTTGNAFYNALWQQAAAEGITVVISAGDSGSAGCDNPSSPASGGVAVSGLASTPFNVAMGGTDFDDGNNQTTFWNAANTSTTPPVPASAKGYIPEITWNDSCAATGITGCAGLSSTATSLNAVAGSGGPSSVYTGSLKPSWQTGLGDTARDIPDVSLFSSDGQNKTFYIVCEQDQDIPGDTGCDLTKFTSTSPFHDFQAVGGTSAATPTFAGIIALLNQHLATSGNPTPRQGNVNYVLYGLAKTTANVCNSTGNALPNACVFNDVTKGNVSVACVGGSANCSNTSKAPSQFGAMATASGGTTPAFNAAPGYDLATGLGSINVANLLAKWAPPTLVGTATTLALTGPATATIGASVTFTGTVTKSSGSATPTGLVLLEDQTTGVTITSVPLPSSGAFTITTTLLPAAAAPYNIIAHYGGDGTFGASDSTPAISMTVPKQNSQVLVDFITFATNGTPTQNTASATVAYGANYIMRVDVTNTAGTPCQNASNVVTFVCPTGSIQLFQNPGVALNDFPNAQNANATSVARLNDRGFAEDQPIQLAPGSYHLSATYTADANSSFNSNGTSNTVAVTVTQATTTIVVTPSVTSIASGGSVTLTAKVNTNSNGAGPTGTVQFKNGSSNLGSAVSCTPTSGASTGLASCTATLTTALSQFIPPGQPRTRPQVPVLPVGGIVSVLLIMFLAMQRRRPASKRLGYAAAGLVLLACVVAGFAGCSGASNGSGSGGGGGSHTDSITAVYSGDVNYAGSTSTAVTVAIQ
jgi:subtilase family serine protease